MIPDLKLALELLVFVIVWMVGACLIAVGVALALRVFLFLMDLEF